MARKVNVIGVGMVPFAKPGQSEDYNVMAAKAIRMPIFPQVVPNACATRSPTVCFAAMVAACANFLSNFVIPGNLGPAGFNRQSTIGDPAVNPPKWGDIYAASSTIFRNTYCRIPPWR